jgi:hypothetical protein
VSKYAINTRKKGSKRRIVVYVSVRRLEEWKITVLAKNEEEIGKEIEYWMLNVLVSTTSMTSTIRNVSAEPGSWLLVIQTLWCLSCSGLHDDAPAGLGAAAAVARLSALWGGRRLDDGGDAGGDTGRHGGGVVGGAMWDLFWGM